MSNVFGISEGAIDDTSSMDSIENWDSLRHMNLVLALEERFQITFTPEQTVEILNYALIKTVLKEHGVSF